MFPLRDHNPSTRTPYVTYALIAANLLVFVAMLPFYGNEPALGQIYVDFGLVPARVLHGQQFSSFVTSMFVHGGVMHLGGNMLFLWIFGDNLEDRLGHVGFALFYLASGIGAALLQILSAPDSYVPMVGASGAIAGVMGGYLLLFPKAQVDVLIIFIIFFRVFALPAWILLVFWFGLQVFSGAASPADAGGVAYWAHAGGFIVGFLWVLPIWLRAGGVQFWARNQGQPPHPETEYSKTRIPRVRRQ